ncbi:protein immune deficiency isoform X2 [Prorops nasuta]
MKGTSLPNAPQSGFTANPLNRQQSMPNTDTPTKSDIPRDQNETANDCFAESGDYRKHGQKARMKSKSWKNVNGVNVITYNIVNSNKVQIGLTKSYICNMSYGNAGKKRETHEEPKVVKPKLKPMTDDVITLSCCSEEISLPDMLIVKTHLGYGWKEVAKRLSYSDGQIDQFHENYKNIGLDEVIYQFLLDWKQNRTREASLGHLVTVMWACQQYDCVERLVATRHQLS